MPYNGRHMRKTVALIVLDGWGIGKDSESNPIHLARPKHLEALAKEFPVTSLQASGVSVGLPWGEVGNSEVGHLTLGAGRVIYQHLPRITMAIQDGTFFNNKVLMGAFAHAKKNGGAINFAGLLTSGTVHASIDHLQALVTMAEREGVPVKLHLFADGVDSPPRSLAPLLSRVPKEKIGSLIGRAYAMNRNLNWTLTARAYDCMTGAGQEVSGGIDAAVAAFSAKHTSEASLPPTLINKNNAIADGDALFFFNFREDSIRQITEPFVNPAFSSFPVRKFEWLFVAMMTLYDARFPVPVAFPSEAIPHCLGEVLAEGGNTQLRLAETYKYAHVTYFFNAYHEPPFTNEYRVLIPSLGQQHIVEHPEMMAPAITDRIIEAIQSEGFDFILANYANADTIAHTGDLDACVATVRVIDNEMRRLTDAALAGNTTLIITSDHGNIEEVMDSRTGEPETEHNGNPVPLYLVGNDFRGKRFPNADRLLEEPLGILSDVAPTILALMNIPKPQEMAGGNLLRKML